MKKLTNAQIMEILKDNEYGKAEQDVAKVFHNDGQHLGVDMTICGGVMVMGFVCLNGEWFETWVDGEPLETDNAEHNKLVEQNFEIVDEYMEKNDLI